MASGHDRDSVSAKLRAFLSMMFEQSKERTAD